MIKKIPFSFLGIKGEKTMRKGAAFSIRILACLLVGLWAACGGVQLAYGQCPVGATCASFKTWAVGADPTIAGHNPHATIDDVAGLTSQVSAPAMVTAMENTCGGACGLLYWNPSTNAFKTFCVTGGFDFAVDLNSSATVSAGPPAFGGGDVWSAVFGNSSFSPYMNFRGSGSFRRWDVGAGESTGIRVNPANGKVYLGNFSFPAEIIELDSATNTVRKFLTGNSPYQLFFDGTFLWATAVAGGGFPDQILRLDPSAITLNLTRWSLPVNGSFQSFVTGNPNYITKDLEGKVWVTETAASKVARLDPVANTITEWTKGGIAGPQNIASSGTLITLQAFFTETPGNTVSVLTPSMSTIGVVTVVVPSVSTVTPSTSSATPVDFTPAVLISTITPVTTTSVGVDPSGIFRFPTPAPSPRGMTRVAFPQTVFGSLEEFSDSRTMQVSSPAIVAPPLSGGAAKVTGGGFIAVTAPGKPPGAATFGFEVDQDSSGVVTGNLEYHNHPTGENVKSVAITTLTVSGNTATFSGTCTNNGTPCTFSVTVQDNGEPGAGKDTFSITGTVITSESGTLQGGNIEIHKSS